MIDVTKLVKEDIMKLKAEEIAEFVTAHGEEAWLEEVMTKEYKKKDGTPRSYTLMDVKMAFGRKFAPHLYSNKPKKPSKMDLLFKSVIGK